MSRTSRSSRSRAQASSLTTRSKLVWSALLLSMTGTGGLMYALQGGPAPRLDGLALPPLVAAAGPSSIEAVYKTRAAIEPGRWKSIVIHHSGTTFGTPASLHEQARAMSLEGLGYHFVIGNGSGMEDGEVHVGYRWLEQLPGAHVAGAKGDWYNRNSIGICIVGDGRRREFTPEEMRRLVQLTASLAEKLKIPADKIVLHSDLVATDDPGPFFPEAAFREQLAHAR